MAKKDKVISALAFNIGEEIEKLIYKQADQIQDENKLLQARILSWYVKTKDESFAKYFHITECREGSIENN